MNESCKSIKDGEIGLFSCQFADKCKLMHNNFPTVGFCHIFCLKNGT